MPLFTAWESQVFVPLVRFSYRSFSEKYTVIVWKVHGLLNYMVLDFVNYTVLKLKQYGLLKLFGSTNES